QRRILPLLMANGRRHSHSSSCRPGGASQPVVDPSMNSPICGLAGRMGVYMSWYMASSFLDTVNIYSIFQGRASSEGHPYVCFQPVHSPVECVPSNRILDNNR